MKHLIQKYKCDWQKISKVFCSSSMHVQDFLQLLVQLLLIRILIQDDRTLLHFAVHSGNIELVDWLIKELGFDVQKVTKVRQTGVH